jgi:dihydropteroate synthase
VSSEMTIGQIARMRAAAGRPLVMGILNVTPDSFFDGGRYVEPARAIARGLEIVAEGAEVVDVGGESTRPGAKPVPEDEELQRVLPVVRALAEELDGRALVSVDTRRRRVAEEAIEAGAGLLNDVSASLAPVAAAAGVPWVAMHMRGTPETMQDDPHYDDVVGEVRAFLVQRAEHAKAIGVPEVLVDPGIGFGKRLEHNLALLASLDVLAATGYPVLVGTSRKSFLGRIEAGPGRPPAPPEERFEGSVATAVWAMLAGATMVRVHDVAATVQAATLVGDARLAGSREPELQAATRPLRAAGRGPGEAEAASGGRRQAP